MLKVSSSTLPPHTRAAGTAQARARIEVRSKDIAAALVLRRVWAP